MNWIKKEKTKEITVSVLAVAMMAIGAYLLFNLSKMTWLSIVPMVASIFCFTWVQNKIDER